VLELPVEVRKGAGRRIVIVIETPPAQPDPWTALIES